MNVPATSRNAEFDEFAENYEEALEKGISVSGENKEFFAAGRVKWLAKRLGSLSFLPRQVLDFGCGTGSATPFLIALPGVDRLTGLELSSKSIAVARSLHGSDRAEFKLYEEFQPDEQIDLVFCNGVFHHILPSERPDTVAYILRALRPGGLFALWENNPWNPGARYVMRRIRFDRDAVPLSVLQCSRLLTAAGFDIICKDFLFIFPNWLRWFRRLEPPLSRLPLGAQYLVIARKRS